MKRAPIKKLPTQCRLREFGVSYQDGLWKFTASWTFRTFEEAKVASDSFNADRFGEFLFNPANDNTAKLAAA